MPSQTDRDRETDRQRAVKGEETKNKHSANEERAKDRIREGGREEDEVIKRHSDEGEEGETEKGRVREKGGRESKEETERKNEKWPLKCKPGREIHKILESPPAPSQT